MGMLANTHAHAARLVQVERCLHAYERHPVARASRAAHVCALACRLRGPVPLYPSHWRPQAAKVGDQPLDASLYMWNNTIFLPS